MKGRSNVVGFRPGANGPIKVVQRAAAGTRRPWSRSRTVILFRPVDTSVTHARWVISFISARVRHASSPSPPFRQGLRVDEWAGPDHAHHRMAFLQAP